MSGRGRVAAGFRFISAIDRSRNYIPPAFKSVLAYLARRAGRDGKAWPCQARIADETGFSVRTVQRALAWLEAHRFLARAGGRRWRGMRGRAVVIWRIVLETLTDRKHDRVSPLTAKVIYSVTRLPLAKAAGPANGPLWASQQALGDRHSRLAAVIGWGHVQAMTEIEFDQAYEQQFHAA